MSSNPFFRTALDYAPPSAATKERYGRARRSRPVQMRDDHHVTCIEWSAGDDDEHEWFWCAKNAMGRTLAYGYLHTQDEDAVIKACGESGADVPEDAQWVAVTG